MGLLDRDYYRDDDGGPIAAWLRQGLVTKIIVAICVSAFLIQISTQNGRVNSGRFTETLALNGARVVHQFEAWRLITYAFLSSTGELLPFLLNIPLLWVAGQEVEGRIGRRRFLTFFLFAAVLSGAAYVAAAAAHVGGSSLDRTIVVGCTAPVTALLAWLILQAPRMRLTFFYSLTIPIWLILAAVVLMDIYGLAWPRVPGEDGRKLTLAGHLGGVLVALLFHGLLRSSMHGRRVGRRVVPRSDPDLRIFREETRDPYRDDDDIPAPVPTRKDLDEHLEAQLDAVLAKVAAQGQQSLTSAEREILNRASEVYRKRRR